VHEVKVDFVKRFLKGNWQFGISPLEDLKVKEFSTIFPFFTPHKDFFLIESSLSIKIHLFSKRETKKNSRICYERKKNFFLSEKLQENAHK
jgi:hypothetical protein